MSAATDVAEFLLARYAEQEATAKAASPSPWTYPGIESVAGGSLYDETRRIASISWDNVGDHDGSIVRFLPYAEADANGAHIIANDPARVLADLAAKRKIIKVWDTKRYLNDRGEVLGGNGPETHYEVLWLLATAFKGHPDFNPAWEPQS